MQEIVIQVHMCNLVCIYIYIYIYINIYIYIYIYIYIIYFKSMSIKIVFIFLVSNKFKLSRIVFKFEERKYELQNNVFKII